MREALAAAFTTGECRTYRTVGPGPQGGARTFQARVIPVIEQGEPRSAIVIATDISEREQADARAQMLMHSVDVHADGAYWMDTEHRFVYVNRAGCQALGYEREQLLRMTVFDVNPAATVEGMGAVWERLRRVGSFRSESIHRRADGSEFPVEIATTHIHFGEREYACGFARDITARRRAEQALRESQELFARTFQPAPVSMTLATLADGVTLKANDAALRVSVFTREERRAQLV